MASAEPYKPPLSPYNLRRLREIDDTGMLSGGCPSCRKATIDRFVTAGWVVYLPNAGRWTLTDSGKAALEGGWRMSGGEASTTRIHEYERLLTPLEVAQIFRVSSRTVSRWADSGRLKSVRTLGGHRRFREAEVRALLAPDTEEVSE